MHGRALLKTVRPGDEAKIKERSLGSLANSRGGRGSRESPVRTITVARLHQSRPQNHGNCRVGFEAAVETSSTAGLSNGNVYDVAAVRPARASSQAKLTIYLRTAYGVTSTELDIT